MFLSSSFKFYPSGIYGTDGDGLEDAQEASVAYGHTPAHFVEIKSPWHLKSLRKSLNPKDAIVWGTLFHNKVKMLSTAKCIRIQSVDLSVYPLKLNSR